MQAIGRLTPIWRWQDGSFDRCRVLQGPEGWRIDGRHDDMLYQIATDAAWHCIELRLHPVAERQPYRLILTREDAGWRSNDGAVIPQSETALDIDLSWTVLTNTFPIRRLIAEGRTFGAFDVLWIKSPDEPPVIAHQTYSYGNDGWFYENHTSEFSAVLTVDSDGLVTDYPGVCKQERLKQ